MGQTGCLASPASVHRPPTSTPITIHDSLFAWDSGTNNVCIAINHVKRRFRDLILVPPAWDKVGQESGILDFGSKTKNPKPQTKALTSSAYRSYRRRSFRRR